MPASPDNLDPSNLALFLDVDGTLLDIGRPTAGVRAGPSLVEILANISTGVGGMTTHDRYYQQPGTLFGR